MKALVKKIPEKGLWLEDVAKPIAGELDVLIRIKKTAICGTDVHIYKWDEWARKTIPVPMHVGHEFVGEIVELGRAVTGLKVGLRVSGEGHIVEAFEVYETDDGLTVVTLLPEMVGVHWKDDLGFTDFDVLDFIAENDFLRIKEMFETSSDTTY